jgi:hypothetical protein
VARRKRLELVSSLTQIPHFRPSGLAQETLARQLFLALVHSGCSNIN